MSEDAREMLRELLAEALAGTNGHAVVPQIPPPPVAGVHRPSTWGPQTAAEPVTLGSDDDLNRFAQALLARPPEEREAILAGRLRFTLGAAAGSPSGGAPHRAPFASSAARSPSARSTRPRARAPASSSARAQS